MKRIWNTTKEELIDMLRNFYNDNKLNEKDENTILRTLDFLGFDVSMI